MIKKIIIGNWKTNPSDPKIAKKLFTDLSRGLRKIKKTEVVICPPPFFQSLFLENKNNLIILGSQNIGLEKTGSYTGELSPRQLYFLGGKYSIIGHSEIRKNGETDEIIAKKIYEVISEGIIPILCIGETVRNESENFLKIIKNQIQKDLSLLSKDKFPKILIAYEPVWAIGEKAIREATVEEIKEMSIFIKKTVKEMFKIDKMPKILYGGSIDEINSEKILKLGGIDGLLVGRTSLDSKKFLKIISYAEENS